MAVKTIPPTLKNSWADDYDEEDDNTLEKLASFPLPQTSKPKQPTTQTKPNATAKPKNTSKASTNDNWRSRNQPATKDDGFTTVGKPKTAHNEAPKHTREDVKWESKQPIPANADERPELWYRSSFLVGVQRFPSERDLYQHLTKHGVEIAELRITRTERQGEKPFALLIAKNPATFKKFMEDESTIVINPYLPDDSEIQFRTAEPYVPRDDQDPNTIFMKGILPTVDQVKEFFAVLGEPRSITISPRCNGVFVRWDNTLAPYMAVELFSLRTLAGKTVDIRIARA